jgi:hypothetical protein
MKTSHRLATAIAATFCVAATLPAWAAPRFLESAISFSDLRISTSAIDPDGPAPGVVQTSGPFGYLHNELCFIPASCARADAYDTPYRPDSTPMPLHTTLEYLGSSISGHVAPGMTSIAAHIEFTEGTRQNKGVASADLMLPMFDVLPNTAATFSVRLHGMLSATDPDFRHYGMLYAWSFVSGEVGPQRVDLWLLPGPMAQTFDQRMTIYVHNDGDEAQRAWWALRSGFELQLLVPEAGAWLMWLSGLGVLAAATRRAGTAGALPTRG